MNWCFWACRAGGDTGEGDSPKALGPGASSSQMVKGSMASTGVVLNKVLEPGYGGLLSVN